MRFVSWGWLVLRSRPDNYIANIHIWRLLDRERDSAGNRIHRSRDTSSTKTWSWFST